MRTFGAAVLMEVAFQLVWVLQAREERVADDLVMRIDHLAANGREVCGGGDRIDHSAQPLQLCDALVLLLGLSTLLVACICNCLGGCALARALLASEVICQKAYVTRASRSWEIYRWSLLYKLRAVFELVGRADICGDCTVRESASLQVAAENRTVAFPYKHAHTCAMAFQVHALGTSQRSDWLCPNKHRSRMHCMGRTTRILLFLLLALWL